MPLATSFFELLATLLLLDIIIIRADAYIFLRINR